MDRDLANRAFKSPPSIGADTRHHPHPQQDALAHERQRRAVEQSVLRRDVKLKRPA